RGTAEETSGILGNSQSSSCFLSCNENAGVEPYGVSCSYCPGGLFVDTQLFSSLKLQPSSSSDETEVYDVPLAPVSLFLLGPQRKSSLRQDGEPVIRNDNQQSLAKGVFSWDKCVQMFCLGRRPIFSSNIRKKGFLGFIKSERGRISDANGQFLSMSLSMNGKGDILQSSTSFLGEKSLDDSVTVSDGAESAELKDIAAKEISDRPKQAFIEEKEKFRGKRALNTSKHLWAGAIAAMVSRTFVAPLERLKLEYIVRGERRNIFELVQFITASQGLKGFWKGNVVNLLRTAPFKAINFYAYDTYRKKLLKMTGNEDTTNFERFVAGAAAGVTATILCIPMDTIRTRMVAPGGEALGGVIGVCRHMIQTEGFFSLYKGLLPALISMAPSGAVFYGVYDILKSSFLHSPEGKKRLQFIQREGRGESNALDRLELGPMRTLLYGAIAGACAEAATYPFEVVRRHLQMQVRATRMNALTTCANIVQQGGVSALYAGLIPSMLQ
ncbi:hypothetical protein KI387_037290, partial [Taxus chinensis]